MTRLASRTESTRPRSRKTARCCDTVRLRRLPQLSELAHRPRPLRDGVEEQQPLRIAQRPADAGGQLFQLGAQVRVQRVVGPGIRLPLLRVFVPPHSRNRRGYGVILRPETRSGRISRRACLSERVPGAQPGAWTAGPWTGSARVRRRARRARTPSCGWWPAGRRWPLPAVDAHIGVPDGDLLGDRPLLELRLPVGKVPSTSSAETGRRSPSPAISKVVTRAKRTPIGRHPSR